jgi:hypothetical protein
MTRQLPCVIVLFLFANGALFAADRFYLPADPGFTIVDSIKASVRFANHCLVPEGEDLRANSTFVDPDGVPALWHEFGSLEGVGWAANAVGGANELIQFARFFKDAKVEENAGKLLRHAAYGGFVDMQTGFMRPYRDPSNGKYYLNYLHQEEHDNWFCPGSAAKVALQFLQAGELMAGTKLGDDCRARGLKLAGWYRDHIKPAPNGWFPRRCYPDGRLYPYGPMGKDADKLATSSGDSLYLLWLYAKMAHDGDASFRPLVGRPLKSFMDAGGHFASMNHDTYDPHENVCYAVAFRVLWRIADWKLCDDPKAVRKFAFDKCLGGLKKFEMTNNRNGVATRGMLYMEKSWDTAYLWENAEGAMAYLEAAKLTGNREYLDKGITILRAAAKHHHGKHGFLTEGVDWNNHNHQWREVGDKKIPIHVDGVVYGDVNYTQPLLNNLHIVEPTLYYLEHFAKRSGDAGTVKLVDHESNVLCKP